MTPLHAGAPQTPGLRHETLAYRGDDEFLDGVLRFVREGLEQGEAVVVAEPPHRLAQLRAALTEDAGSVEFLDMTEIGANPGRIIDVWTSTLDRYTRAGRTLRGVGEPAYPGRSPAELVECEVHESLLNDAFPDGPVWRLLCPYDQEGLPPSVCTRALTTHPLRSTPDGPVPSEAWTGSPGSRALTAPLPAPTDAVLRGGFRAGDLPAVRRTVAQYARSCGLSADQVEALELAASELASNSVRHGGGGGSLAMWTEPAAAVVEFTDAGSLRDPLVGRRRPDPAQGGGGRGVYLVHQLCDLVQVRSGSRGTTVRVTAWR